MRRAAIIGALILAAGAAAFFLLRGSGRVAEVRLAVERSQLPPPTPPATSTVISAPPVTSTPTTTTPARAPSLPASVNLAVPFTSQAPLSNWDAVHEETCEEASLAMADAFFDGRSFTPQSAEDELLALVEWQKQRFGYFESTTAEEVALTYWEYYGRQAEVIATVDVPGIKRALAAGKLVILPVYGRGFNPFFRQPGPVYHMLVVKGYTGSRFITNDPGTRHGAEYPYTFEHLLEAVHDWNGGDVLNGQKAMIIVSP